MLRARRSEVVQPCIDVCLACYSVCAQTSAHCLIREERQVDAARLRLLNDCAEICRTTADFTLRGSELQDVTRDACAMICERCAESCRSIPDDPQLLRCAEACERCAAACLDMLEAARCVEGRARVGLSQKENSVGVLGRLALRDRRPATL